MTGNEYALYLCGTVDNYPRKYKNYLCSQFKDIGVAQVKPQISLSNYVEGAVDVSELELTEQIKVCLRDSEKAIKLYELWEFQKDYKYSTVFTVVDFDKMLCSLGRIPSIMDASENEKSFLFEDIQKPLRYENEDMVIIKFCIKFEAINSINGDNLLMKYPMLVVAHKRERIVEIRYDFIKRVFLPETREQTIYVNLISDIVYYFRDYLDIQLDPMDLQFLIVASKNDQTVRRIGQYMELPGGGNAQLEVGNNQNYTLPIIGQLKELMGKYASELDKTPILKDALNDFIYENDELSDYKWIELLWEGEVKSKNIQFKIVFNYKNTSYCLVQHLHNDTLTGMERMNRVIRYINENRIRSEAECVN